MNILDRREAILRLAALMGGTISAPLWVGLLEGCQTKTKTGEESATKPMASDNHQKMIAEIAEIIVPTTDTPGAKAAKVPEFITVMLADCYSEEDQKTFYAGLDKLEEDAKKAHGHPFLECKPNQQIELLKKVENAAAVEREKLKEAMAKPKDPMERATTTPLFFPLLKELTLVGYFTSEIGATKALEYLPVPTRYEGCIPLKAGQKAWATS
ncbi:MAG: gluconate 2-dehydrogenase subunit 3 family protein [Bacteroidota bacterium]